MTATQNPPAGFSFLVRNSAAQHDTFRDAFALLDKAIAARAFPACALAISRSGELIAYHALGRFTYDPASSSVSTTSIFDLASLSKAIATTAMAMILYERGLLDLETPVTAIVPEFATDNGRRRDVTLRMLLAHSSGLPAYEKLFLRAKTHDELLAAAFTTELTADPGTRAEYSDIGFIILGIALERLADEPLDTFCQREIFGPLGMSHTTFNPPKAWKDRIVPTADECGTDTPVRQTLQSPALPAPGTFRGRVIQGEVQDENASVLGGVAGHAGLFAPAEDVAIFAHAMLSGGRPILRPETVELFSRRELTPPGTSRALGWDTPSSPSQSGKYFGSRSFGHLGYTGTSLWIDPDRQLSVTLLTNRTWPDGQNQAIKQVRPAFHDAVIEALKACGTTQ
ncbi:MAG: beta-lactamase family protein [Acidobacteriales bacterium]|nr:beta-lactamase family protein [Terriglobales bacterium]